MKLSTFNKVEAVFKTVTQLTVIGSAHAAQTAIKKYQDDTTRQVNASIGMAARESYVGKKSEQASTAVGNRYAAMRDKLTAEKVAVQPATFAEPVASGAEV